MTKSEQVRTFDLIRKELNDQVSDLQLSLQRKTMDFDKSESDYKKYKESIAQQDQTKELQRQSKKIKEMETEIKNTAKLRQEVFEGQQRNEELSNEILSLQAKIEEFRKLDDKYKKRGVDPDNSVISEQPSMMS